MIDELQEQVDAANTIIADKDATLDAANATIAENEATIAQKDKLIKSFMAKIRELEDGKN